MDLESQLERERTRNQELSSTIDSLKQQTALLLNACEQAQEGVSNRLLREIRRLRDLQLSMCDEVEARESRLVDVLEERVKAIRHEKVELENALEQEQERLVNRLQRQMDEIKTGSATNSGSEGPNSCIKSGTSSAFGHAPYLESSHSASVASPALSDPQTVALIRDQISSATAHHLEREQERISLYYQFEYLVQRMVEKLQDELQQVMIENMQLNNRLRRQSIESSPLLEPLPAPGSLPLKRTDSQSSWSGLTGNGPAGLSPNRASSTSLNLLSSAGKTGSLRRLSAVALSDSMEPASDELDSGQASKSPSRGSRRSSQLAL